MKLTTAHLRRIIQEEAALIMHESIKGSTAMETAIDNLLIGFPGQEERLLSMLSAKVMKKKTARPGTERVILSPEEAQTLKKQLGF